MSEGKAGRPRKYSVAQVRAAVEKLAASLAEASSKWVIAARDVAAVLEQEHGIAPTMRLDTLQAQIDDVAAELKKQETDAQRTTLTPEQAEALRVASATIEDVLVRVLAEQNARAEALDAAMRARATAEDDERRQRMLELSVQIDEARDLNDRLAASVRALEERLAERDREMPICFSRCRGSRG